MIRFQCPRCRSVLEAPDHRGGAKINCLKCQQRLQIPVPPPGKTLLPPLVSHTPPSPPPMAVIPAGLIRPVPPPSTIPAAAIQVVQAQTPPEPSGTPFLLLTCLGKALLKALLKVLPFGEDAADIAKDTYEAWCKESEKRDK